MAQGDATLGKIVTGIKASPAWKRGRNAIVLVWDENDFTNAANRVVMLVETSYGANAMSARSRTITIRCYERWKPLRPALPQSRLRRDIQGDERPVRR